MINQKKIDILQRNFEITSETILDDYTACRTIEKIMDQMTVLDIDLMFEMWKYLISKYEHILKEVDEKSVVTLISGDFVDYSNYEIVLKRLEREPDLLKKIIGYSAYPPISMLSSVIDSYKNISYIENILKLVASNPNNNSEESDNYTFDDLIVEISDDLWKLDEFPEARQQVAHLLMYYVESMTTLNKRAIAEVTLIEYL